MSAIYNQITHDRARGLILDVFPFVPRIICLFWVGIIPVLPSSPTRYVNPSSLRYAILVHPQILSVFLLFRGFYLVTQSICMALLR